MIRNFILAVALILVSGCKLAVIVVDGGEVQSTFSGTCLAGTVCMHELVDTSYAESFTAVPDPGWAFVKWNAGGDFFCKDSTNATCVVSNVGTGSIAVVAETVASNKTFYIMPIFEQLSVAPITDTVMVNSVEWAQPD